MKNKQKSNKKSNSESRTDLPDIKTNAQTDIKGKSMKSVNGD